MARKTSADDSSVEDLQKRRVLGHGTPFLNKEDGKECRRKEETDQYGVHEAENINNSKCKKDPTSVAELQNEEAPPHVQPNIFKKVKVQITR